MIAGAGAGAEGPASAAGTSARLASSSGMITGFIRAAA
jgi:hypothetical protein